MVRVAEGMRVESQNTIGTRDLDLLRVTDWFFPNGLNHHELFAGIPGVQNIMQGFARRVAGLGTMPARDASVSHPAQRRAVDVLVVGGGPSGLLMAQEAARLGRSVEVLDDGIDIGGSLRGMMSVKTTQFGVDGLLERDAAQVRLRPQSIAGAFFEGELLVVGAAGAELVKPRALVLATGAHDTMPPFDCNDLPGVMSARSAAMLLKGGVRPGFHPVVIEVPGGGPFGESVASQLGVALVRGTVIEASGTSAVTSVTVMEEGRKRRIETDALIVCGPRAPAYELAVQCGAEVYHTPEGYVAKAELGHLVANVFGIGELVGTALDASAMRIEAQQVAARLP
jgi:sarcosine oxidase, subunit alpha